MGCLCFQKRLHDCLSQTPLVTYKALTSVTYYWLLHYYAAMEHQKLGKSKRVCELKEPVHFLLVLGIVSRNNKTRKLLLHSCMYRFNFSFTLKLTTLLLQKLATFCMWIVKQKEDKMDKNTLHSFYGDYTTMNQQI